MTVPATTRRAGPFNGNGVTTAYPFTFKVFEKADVAVTLKVTCRRCLAAIERRKTPNA